MFLITIIILTVTIVAGYLSEQQIIIGFVSNVSDPRKPFITTSGSDVDNAVGVGTKCQVNYIDMIQPLSVHENASIKRDAADTTFKHAKMVFLSFS